MRRAALRLLRRRQLQRDRRPACARRPRHRCDAHQPAQDLLDAPWRRRSGCRARWCCPEALAPYCAAAVRREAGRQVPVLVEEETAGEHHAATFGRMVAFHGQMGMFTRALTYILSHGADGLAPGRGGRGAQRQLYPALAGGRARRAVREDRAVHARGDLQRQGLARGLVDDRHRQGADRRGLSTR